MANENDKFKDLVDRVHNGLELISDEDLNVLFQETEQAAALSGTEPTAQTPAATTPPAPQATTPSPPEGTVADGKANLLTLVPDRFKEKDEAESIKKMAQVISDLETRLGRQSSELTDAQAALAQRTREPVVTTNEPVNQTVEEEIDDSMFFDRPTEITKKVAEKIAREIFSEGIKNYDTFASRRSTLLQFKKDHADFDNFRNEIAEVCRLHPDWDQDINGLPKIYEEAKKMAIARAREINPASAINVEELTAKIKAEVEASAFEKAKTVIKEEILKRKSAAGIVTQNATDSQTRLQDVPRTVPETEDEKVFSDMLAAGPKNLGL